MFIRLFPVMLSTVLLATFKDFRWLAAHFVRFYGLLPALFCLLLLLTLFIRKMWVIRFWHSLLLLGTFIWIDTAVNLIRIRETMNLPWTRLAT